MNEREFKQIDQVIYTGNLPIPRRDEKLGELLVSLLNSKEPQFILMNKAGVHFPYYSSYPRGFGLFDAGPGGAPGPTSKREHILGAYYNGILWSVDRFFQKFLFALQRKNTVIIYTSDHGQSFSMKNNALIGHCSIGDSAITEVLVPMLAISGNSELRNAFDRSARAGFNRMTHFQLFPTLLNLMGYERKWVSGRYGSDLLSAPPRVRRFRNGSIFLDARDKLRPIRRGRWIEVDRID